MPGMPDIILKAPVFKRIGDATRVKGFHKSTALAAIIADLKNSNMSLIDVAISAGMYQDHGQAAHLNKDWLNSQKNGFWNNTTYDVPALVRAGILDALETYRKTGKPLDLLWAISGPNPTDPWIVSAVECSEHIVVTFFTPNVPCALPIVTDYSIRITEQDPATGSVSTRYSHRPAGG